MKTFTYPQSKWVMAAALLAVLGFNVSFNPHQGGIASADFASTSGDLVESKLVTVDGVMPVKYINNGESEVLAVVPKKMTEGKVCDTCGYETIPLATKNKQDIDALNVQLLKAMQKSNAKPEVAREEDAVETKEEKVVEKKNPFEAIEKSCGRYKESTEVLSCTSEKFVSVLRKKNGPEIDKLDALDFYRSNIENAIKNQITEARRLANKTRRASVSQAQMQMLQESNDWSGDANDILAKAGQVREAALKAVRTVLAGIPSKYEDIRKRLLIAETEIAKEEAYELQQTFIQARDSKDPSQGVYLFKEGELRRVDLQDLIQGMQYHSDAGLSKAYAGKDISADLQAQYEAFFNDFAQKMRDGMWQNPYAFMGATNGNTTLPGIDFTSRLANPGRGSGVIVAPGSISNSVGTQLAAPGTLGMQRSGLSVQTSANPALVMPTQNSGVGFGPMSPATADSLRMRAMIRGQ